MEPRDALLVHFAPRGGLNKEEQQGKYCELVKTDHCVRFSSLLIKLFVVLSKCALIRAKSGAEIKTQKTHRSLSHLHYGQCIAVCSCYGHGSFTSGSGTVAMVTRNVI